ncbi:hypothetical protein BDW75DRAFT_205909 [Aspergillus navahoensis]
MVAMPWPLYTFPFALSFPLRARENRIPLPARLPRTCHPAQEAAFSTIPSLINLLVALGSRPELSKCDPIKRSPGSPGSIRVQLSPCLDLLSGLNESECNVG